MNNKTIIGLVIAGIAGIFLMYMIILPYMYFKPIIDLIIKYESLPLQIEYDTRNAQMVDDIAFGKVGYVTKRVGNFKFKVGKVVVDDRVGAVFLIFKQKGTESELVNKMNDFVRLMYFKSYKTTSPMKKRDLEIATEYMISMTKDDGKKIFVIGHELFDGSWVMRIAFFI